jgi:hypothetical protein
MQHPQGVIHGFPALNGCPVSPDSYIGCTLYVTITSQGVPCITLCPKLDSNQRCMDFKSTISTTGLLGLGGSNEN